MGPNKGEALVGKTDGNQWPRIRVLKVYEALRITARVAKVGRDK